MLLSDIFCVSVDYLLKEQLKEEKIAKDTKENGFYVSREMAEAYISS